MEGPRSARIEELPLVEVLANKVFRGKADLPQTMFQEYPDLYHPDNIENIMIITEAGKPISNINFLPQQVSIYGAKINLATLGGVCTDPEQRGKGYASTLLDECISRIGNMGADILLISGDKQIYLSVGSMHAGVVYRFTVDKDKCAALHNQVLSLSEYDESEFNGLAMLYRKENVRFLRPYDRFRLLMKSRKFVHNNDITRRNLMIRNGKRLSAYTVITTKDNEASMHDFAGGIETILAAGADIMKIYGIEKLNGYLMAHDTDGIEYCSRNGIELKPKRYPGTLRIMNFEGFMNSLRPYFREIYDNKFLDGLCFRSDNDGFHFIRDSGYFTVVDRNTLNDLIFGAETAFAGDCGLFEDFFRSVFPIPFVYTENLSYS